jgi:formamidopyrimidine-DNA glycosylase
MPELPEVETTRRSFADRIEGATVTAIRLGKPLRWPLGCEAALLVGRRVGAPARRGKYLWLPVGEGGLLMHLGMSGSLAFGADMPAPGAHDHFDLVTSRGTLRLHDPRRFGAVVWSPTVDAAPAATLLAGLGLEPFDPAFTGEYLHRALRGRRVAIKQALLAGDIVVGAGNIYACESLFEAGIDPRTAAGRVSRPRCERLAAAVRRILAQALELGGSTLRDFRDAHGMAGSFQQRAAVYGREGQPCAVCGTSVRRIVQAQRSTFFCPRCQRR